MRSAVEIADARANKPGHQLYAGRSRAIIERASIALRSSTWVPIATGFIEPVLYLLAFGYGMGALIGDISTSAGAIDYTVFIAPGLLATSAMNGAIYDSTWNVFFKLNESKLYQGMLATPLGPLDVALGEIIWALFRGLSYSIAFMLITAPLGLVPSWSALLAIPAAVLIAFGFASFGMAITSYFKTYQQMGLINVSLFWIAVSNFGVSRLVRVHNKASSNLAWHRIDKRYLVWCYRFLKFLSLKLFHSDDCFRSIFYNATSP
jgi:lipooligosaccharide transport system permease protein